MHIKGDIMKKIALMSTVIIASLMASTVQAAGPAPTSAKSVRALGLTEASFKNVATIQHTIDITGYELIVPKIGPLAMSDLGFGIDKLTVKQPAIEFAPMIPISGLAGATQEDAQNKANQWMALTKDAFITRFANWITLKGISSGIYNFTQDFNMQTAVGLKRKTVLWNVSVDKDGKAIYGNPKIVDGDPLILDVNYVTGGSTAGLPASWRFTEGGKIKWRVLDKKLNPLTNWTIEDVQGVYDSQIKPDALTGRADCLIDNSTAGCSDTVGKKDINKLMNQTGAAFAFVNYVSGLVPEMDQVGDTQVAKGAISVDQRWWNCGTFINKGYFGYVLNANMSRFFVEKQETKPNVIPVGTYVGRVLSPTEPYSKAVPSSAVPGHPDGYIISPHPGDDSLWSVGDPIKMRNVLYISPVGFMGSDGAINTQWRSNSDVVVNQVTNASGVKQYYIGTVGDNYWGDGVYDRSVTFDVQNPAELSQFAIIQEGFDDWFSVKINGVHVFNGPYGGDRLNLITRNRYCNRKDDDPYVCGTTRHVEYGPGWYDSAELQRNWNQGAYIDLRPYLVNGTNRIDMRTIVAGWGEGWILVQTASCGSNLGLPTTLPESPAGAGAVSNTLVRKSY